MQNISKKNTNEKLNFLKIHTFYPEYIHYFYNRNPELIEASFQRQQESLGNDGFFWYGYFARSLKTFGYNANELAWNSEPLQRAWARENGLIRFDRPHLDRKDMEEICLYQVEQMRPDIVWLHHWSNNFLQELKKRFSNIKLILGWVGSNMPKSCEPFFRNVDILFSCAPESLAAASKFREDTYLINHWFDSSVLKLLKEQPIQHDICFSGGLKGGPHLHDKRTELLSNIVSSFDISIYSSERTEHNVIERIRRPALFGINMLQKLKNSRIILNAHADSSTMFASNLRMYEATGVGSCLLTDSKFNMPKIFKPGLEVISYDDNYDCLKKIEWILSNPDKRNSIAESGQQRCLKDHTTEHRLTVFDHVIRSRLAAMSSPAKGRPQMDSPLASVNALNTPPIFTGSLSHALEHLKNLVKNHPRRVPGRIVIDGKTMFFADLHSFYHELTQIFADNLYGLSSPQSPSIILDCGAHVGLASIYFAMRHPNSEIYAYEADPNIFDLYERNILSLGLSRIRRHNAVIWTHNDGVKFSCSHDDAGHVSTDAQSPMLPSLRLRDVLANFEHVDLLKLDIEGAEFAVLKDCALELDKVRALIIETHNFGDDGQSLGQVLTLLEQSGFRFVLSDLHHASWLPVTDAPPFDFVKQDKYIATIFAWRKEHFQTNIEYNVAKNSKKLNIAQFCMQDFGGAGTAALRLHKSLVNEGENNNLYVQNIAKWWDKTALLSQAHPSVKNENFISPEWRAFQTLNRQALSRYLNRPSGLEMFSIPWASTMLKKIPNVATANIINLHWIPGTVSIAENIDFLKNKKIVWTLHDMNPFTGGCHYAGSCQKFEKQCGNCPQLGSDQEHDLSREIWEQKKAAYSQLDITIVVLCQWMADCVKKSSLLSSFPIHIIPNGVPTEIFKPYSHSQIRQALKISQETFVILFGADSVTNARKGFKYLVSALNYLKKVAPSEQLAVITFGHNAQNAAKTLGYQTFCFDYIDKESDLSRIYNAADVTVIPSLEDNLPNIVLESMACGTPVVGFEAGGIPDMVEHQVNGYLAPIGNHEELAKGILWVSDQKKNHSTLRIKCRETILSKFNSLLQAKRYLKLYKETICTRNSKQIIQNNINNNKKSLKNEFKKLTLNDFLNLQFIHEYHDYHSEGTKCIYQDLIKNHFTVKEILYAIQNDEEYLNGSKYDSTELLKNDHMNHYINCIKHGFRKNIHEWRKTESKHLVKEEYYESKNKMTNKEIVFYLKNNPIKIKNNIITDGIHRSMSMIGRLLNGEEYIPFSYIGDDVLPMKKNKIPNIGYRKEHNLYRLNLILPHINKNCFNAIDIGSNYGFFSLNIANDFQNSNVFSFEGEFGTGNKENKGLKIHKAVKSDLHIYNNFIYKALLTDKLITKFNNNKIIFDFQISLSVFHWVVFLKYANDGTSNNIKKMLINHLKMSETTFLELPSFSQNTSMSPLFSEYKSFTELFSDISKEIPLQFEKLGECEWYGIRELFCIKLTQNKSTKSTKSDIEKLLNNL